MIKIGIICPSEIAFRRFMPAIKKATEFEYVGVAYATKEEWFGEIVTEISDESFSKIKVPLKRVELFYILIIGLAFPKYQALTRPGPA